MLPILFSHQESAEETFCIWKKLSHLQVVSFCVKLLKVIRIKGELKPPDLKSHLWEKTLAIICNNRIQL